MAETPWYSRDAPQQPPPTKFYPPETQWKRKPRSPLPKVPQKSQERTSTPEVKQKLNGSRMEARWKINRSKTDALRKPVGSRKEARRKPVGSQLEDRWKLDGIFIF